MAQSSVYAGACRKLRADELAEEASLLLPAGVYGPAFLTPKNYFVIKEYNFSDLYVLFVGSPATASATGQRLRRHGRRWCSCGPPRSRRCSNG